jgi:hypothetical protein
MVLPVARPDKQVLPPEVPIFFFFNVGGPKRVLTFFLHKKSFELWYFR